MGALPLVLRPVVSGVAASAVSVTHDMPTQTTLLSMETCHAYSVLRMMVFLCAAVEWGTPLRAAACWVARRLMSHRAQ